MLYLFHSWWEGRYPIKQGISCGFTYNIKEKRTSIVLHIKVFSYRIRLRVRFYLKPHVIFNFIKDKPEETTGEFIIPEGLPKKDELTYSSQQNFGEWLKNVTGNKGE